MPTSKKPAIAERDPGLEARLSAACQSCRFGGTIYAYSVCDSTMERAHALARDGAGEGTLVFAARQTQGRGRFGRRWESPEGGAYLSLILKPTRPLAEIPQLSLVAGLATAEALCELTQLSPTIRWPNDVLISGKKVAGILTEASSVNSPQSTVHSPQQYVVVGIGINVTTDSKDLPDTATSLSTMVPGTIVEKGTWHQVGVELTAALCTKFDQWYDVWTAQGFPPIRTALRPRLNIGGLIRLTTADSEVEGQATDVDEQGRFLVRLEAGITRAFEVGEVMLLK